MNLVQPLWVISLELKKENRNFKGKIGYVQRLEVKLVIKATIAPAGGCCNYTI